MERIEKQVVSMEKTLDSARRWRSFSVCLLIVIIFLLAAIATSIVYYELIMRTKKLSRHTNIQETTAVEEEPTDPPMFRDLTQVELKRLKRYLHEHGDFNLKHNKPIVSSSFLFLSELHLPNKSQALETLDKHHNAPPREAKVVLFRGDKKIPVIEEYVVGPLANITYHRLLVSKHYQRPAPYLFRPNSKAEYLEVKKLLTDVDEVIKHVLLESYDARFFSCDRKCLVLHRWTVVSPTVSGIDVRKVWYWAHHFTEYYLLNPVDFFILFNLDGNDPSQFHVETIWYNGQHFDTAENLADAFTAGTVKKSSIIFPKENPMHFATLNLRGNQFPEKNMRSPKQVEPDGRRYYRNDRHVTYMGWAFDFRMSTTTGPQLFDIKHMGRRIVYELSLQEISSFHSGFKPWNRYSDMLYSNSLLGYQARDLVPGADCPNSASFISATHWTEHRSDPVTYERAFCLFEHSTGEPLRRHHAYDRMTGRFYGSLEDIVLVLRAIISVNNQDCIVDFIFHQNGALEVKTSLTGYMMAMLHSPPEGRYGFKLRDRLIGTISQHAFNFKVDLDIHDIKNRYETLQFEPHIINNNDWSVEKNSRYQQIKFTRNSKMTELQTLYRKNTSLPLYHIFYNKDYRTTYNDARAYRIQIDGGLTHLLSQGIANEPSISWARYQMAVTRRKDDEGQSSSIYAMWDRKEPIVNFQSFLDDNENVVDTDLVAWVTLGLHHLPQMEDLPLISSVGKRLSFFLTPFNYHDSDPSMASRDAIRMSYEETSGSDHIVRVENYGLPKDFSCDSEFQENSYFNTSELFEQT
ncbi:putative amine oxidase [copper-containing] [Ylistrum balloti]|uniref:putative amine oxidase [copper-containing] n=1 Tax=Ylistrum balloti TaxID=509963 RepID=UPI002905D3F4|nr:putative amine oxidase [copper-containing] [Ylistrum balloti]